jgi:hypothetical protein
MTSFYSIIQLIVDPVADERINLGFIAIEEDQASLWFTRMRPDQPAFSAANSVRMIYSG